MRATCYIIISPLGNYFFNFTLKSSQLERNSVSLISYIMLISLHHYQLFADCHEIAEDLAANGTIAWRLLKWTSRSGEMRRNLKQLSFSFELISVKRFNTFISCFFTEAVLCLGHSVRIVKTLIQLLSFVNYDYDRISDVFRVGFKANFR